MLCTWASQNFCHLVKGSYKIQFQEKFSLSYAKALNLVESKILLSSKELAHYLSFTCVYGPKKIP